MRTGEIVAQRFEIERLAGEGGMGAVYLARDVATGGRVALKVLHGTRLRQSARFQREARLLAELDHPAIVRYIAHGETENGRAYLAMEWLEGESLGDRLHRENLHMAASVRLAIRVADALAVAHDHGVVHRDLKPNNLLLVRGDVERVTLVDFGIARLPAQTQITDTGALVGTVGYMSPEQARGHRDVDARADVFALGAVLFRCVTGRHAFDLAYPLEALVRLAIEDAPRARSLRASVPAALDDLIARMLARAPETRPADGRAARDALAALDEEELAAADAADPPRPRAPHDDTAHEQHRSTALRFARSASPSPGRRRLLWLASAAALGVAGGATLWALRAPPAPRPAPALPCHTEKCRALEVAELAAVDLGELVAPAHALARSVEPAAYLSSFYANHVERGVMDLARADHGQVVLVFAHPLPEGRADAVTGVLAITVQRGVLALTRTPASPFVAPPLADSGPCPSREAWKTAVTHGLSPDSAATFQWLPYMEQSMWMITLAVPDAKGGVWRVDAATCALLPDPSRASAADASPDPVEVVVVNDGKTRLTEVVVEHGTATYTIPSLAPGASDARRVAPLPSAVRWRDGARTARSAPGISGMTMQKGCTVRIALGPHPTWELCGSSDAGSP